MTEEGPPLADRMAGVEMRCAKLESGEPTAKDCARLMARLTEVMRDWIGYGLSDEDAMAELDKIILHATRHVRKELSK